MKKLSTFLLATILLALSQPIFAQDHWRPTAEITDFEKGIIQQTTRQSPDWIYKDAAGFSIKHEVVITILLKDGTIQYFAVSEEKNIDTTNNVVIRAAENYITCSPRGMALYLAEEFKDIWGARNGNDLSEEELQTADKLMYAYLNILQNNPAIASELLEYEEGVLGPRTIGDRGKRYLNAFFQLQLKDEHKLRFYENFLSGLSSTTKDKPDDLDKITAIQAIKQIFLAMDKKSDFAFHSISLEEIKRLDPDFYKSLTAN